MKVLVTGGSGVLGINLIRYLLARGYSDIVSLDVDDFDHVESVRIEALQGDIRDADVVRRAVAGCQVVIHCAAALPSYKAKEIFSIDVDGTRTVVDVAARAGISRVIHISSTAVYGIPEHTPVVEDGPLQPYDDYSRAKIMAEQVCQEYRDLGMCIPILRPKSFIGPERLGIFALLFEWASEGRNFPLLGKGANRYQFLDVADLCEAVHQCMTLPEQVVSDTFNIAAEEYTTMREDYQAVLDAAGHGKRVVAVPVAPALLALRIFGSLGWSPLYKRLYMKLHRDSMVSIEKARRVLGYSPRFSNKQSLVRNYHWYVENRKTIAVPGNSHRVPWKQGIFRLVKLAF